MIPEFLSTAVQLTVGCLAVFGGLAIGRAAVLGDMKDTWAEDRGQS